jgi:hypothetical protein
VFADWLMEQRQKVGGYQITLPNPSRRYFRPPAMQATLPRALNACYAGYMKANTIPVKKREHGFVL